MVILNEVYFGESIVTDRIVDIISRTMNTRIDINKNKNKELTDELCDAIKDFCGARLVTIDMEEDTWGYTIAPPYKERPSYRFTKEGVRFRDNSEVIILVTLNPKILFKDKKQNLLTPRELTAVLLHEIGHNFSKSSLPMESVLETVKMAIKIKNEAMLSAAVNKKININAKDLDNFLVTTKKILSIGIDETKKTIDSAIDIAKITGGAAFSTLQPFMDRAAYADEKFADSFATIYGFGKDLACGLSKMDKESYRKHKNDGIFGMIIAMFKVAFYMLFDEHPDTITRMHNTVETLEYELNKNKALTSDDKKNMKKQITQIKTLIKQSNSIDTSNKYSIPFKIYSNIITHLLGGQEIFGHINKALFNPNIMDYSIRNHLSD